MENRVLRTACTPQQAEKVLRKDMVLMGKATAFARLPLSCSGCCRLLQV